jgi:predicted nucleic acid-binding protein
LIYLDASALVTLISRRAPARELQEYLATKPAMPMGTSTVGFVEAARALDQIGDYPAIMQDLLAEFSEILVTDEVRDAAARLPAGVRTLDAVHIASAQMIGDVLEVLITYDKRMLEVARLVGIPAEAPGLP